MNPEEMFAYLFEEFVYDMALRLGVDFHTVGEQCLMVLARHHVEAFGDKDEGLAYLSAVFDNVVETVGPPTYH